jgi:hypothetical protein
MWDLVVGWLNSPLDRAVFFAGVFGTLFGVSNWLRTDTPKSETDRLAVITALRQDRFGKRYKARLKRALEAIDARLSVAERANGAAPRAVATAWSFGLLNLSLTLALLYPIVSLLVNWGLFNNGAVGGEEVIPKAEPLVRAAMICGLALMVLLRLPSFFLRGRAKIVLEVVSLGLAGAGVSAVSLSGAELGEVALAGAIGIAIAGAGALVGAVVVAFSFCAAFLTAVAFAFPFPFGAWVAFAGAPVFAFAFAFEWIGPRLNLRTTLLMLWAILGAIAVSLAARNGADAVNAKGLILFIGVLPLINGLADFASTGLTRHLLRRSLRTSGRWEAAADLIGGAAICLLLGCAIIAFIEFTPLVDQTRLANLPQIFADLADPATRGQYWWLLVMLASTLIPTALHLHLALATAVRYVPARLRHRIADRFEQAAAADSNLGGRRAVLMLSALNAAAIVIPAWLMIELWITASPLVMGGSIAIFAAFAQAIGAIP